MGLFPGVDRNFAITVEGEKFAGMFPLPRDIREIDIIISRNLGGQPLHSIPQATYQYETICTELEYVLQDRPESWRDISFIECPDPDLVIAIFNEYRKKKDSWKEGLKKNKQPNPPKRAASNNKLESSALSDADLQDTAKRVS